MEFKTAVNHLGNVPYMTREQAKILTTFILENELTDILELGVAHGTSTCYFAAAVEELGRGKVVSLDLDEVRDRQPNIDELIKRTGLEKWIEVITHPISYTWILKDWLKSSHETGERRQFDFIYLDGAHTWDVDGFAFYLVDHFLKPGGWIVFDDMAWSLSNLENPPELPVDVLTDPQVLDIYRLLVSTHPSYDSFHTDGSWGWAHKKSEGGDVDTSKQLELVREIERKVSNQRRFNMFKRSVRKLLGR